MDGEELLNSLQQDADAKVEAVWAEAEAEASRLEAEHAAAVAGLQSNCRQQAAGDVERKKGDVIALAAREAARLRRAAEQALSVRLLSLALASLAAFRDSEAGALLDALSAEVPRLSWGQVRVNPRDAARAQGLYPGATIVTDDSIAGGLDAATADLSIRVVNTLEKRLQNAWEEVLPELMAGCYGALRGH